MPVYLMPTENGRPILLDKAVVFVGRHPDCDVILTRSKKVSRKHCCFAQVDDAIVIRDLGSMNGVRVDGQRVHKQAILAFGQTVSIGDCDYTLQYKEAESESADRSVIADKAASPRPKTPKSMAASDNFPVPIDEAGNMIEADFLNDPAMTPTPDDVPLVDLDDDLDKVFEIKDDEEIKDDKVADFEDEWLPFEDSGEFKESGSKV